MGLGLPARGGGVSTGCEPVMKPNSTSAEGADEHATPGSDQPSTIVSSPVSTDLAALTNRVLSRVRDQPVSPHIEQPTNPEDASSRDRVRRLISAKAVTVHFGWQTPVVGPMLSRIRALFFRDTRAYIDAHLARQAEVDRGLLGTIDDLHREIANLKATIARIQRVD